MASTSPILYLIRHGEKPPKIDGKDQVGLSELGVNRSTALVKVFSKNSKYNIGKIFAQKPKDNGDEDRPFLTIKPTADSLGYNADNGLFDFTIKRDNADHVAKAVKKFDGPGNILICWEHGQLTDVAGAIGVQNPPEYPGDRFDVIWTIEAPYESINDPWTSEHCPGLDDAYANQP